MSFTSYCSAPDWANEDGPMVYSSLHDVTSTRTIEPTDWVNEDGQLHTGCNEGRKMDTIKTEVIEDEDEVDGPDSDDLESCHPDSSDFEDDDDNGNDDDIDNDDDNVNGNNDGNGNNNADDNGNGDDNDDVNVNDNGNDDDDDEEQSPENKLAVKVENLAADRKSIFQKIKATLSKQFGDDNGDDNDDGNGNDNGNNNNDDADNDDDDEQSPENKLTVKVENLAPKIKATLSKQFGEKSAEGPFEHLSSDKEDCSSDDQRVDDALKDNLENDDINAVDDSEGKEALTTAKISKNGATLEHSTADNEEHISVKDNVVSDHNKNAVNSPTLCSVGDMPIKQEIDLESGGYANANYDISELINGIDSRVYRCVICDKSLSDLRAWKGHLQTHDIDVKDLSEEDRINHGESIPDYKCLICGWNGKTKGGLRSHLKSHKSDVSCDVCGMMFRKIKELKIHMRCHDVTEHQCDICKRSFPDPKSLARHEITHTIPKVKRDRFELLCEICSRIFNAPNLLAIHLKTHKNPISRQCRVCDLTFTKASILKKHIRTIHSNVKESIVCRFCKVQFDTMEELKEHMETFGNSFHVKKKTEFKCTECDKVYYTKSLFDAHVMKHTGELPYMCDICGAGFRIPYSLKKHMFVHGGSRPHQCEQCGKSFLYNSSLTRHQHIHSDEKPFVCKTCGKGFGHSSYLKKHKKLHEVDEDGKRPIVQTPCPICHKQYSYIDIHLKTHFKNQPFKPKSFFRDLPSSSSDSSRSGAVPSNRPTKTMSLMSTKSVKSPHISTQIETSSITHHKDSFQSNDPSPFPKDIDKTSTNDTASDEKDSANCSDEISDEMNGVKVETTKNINSASNMESSDDKSEVCVGFDDAAADDDTVAEDTVADDTVADDTVDDDTEMCVGFDDDDDNSVTSDGHDSLSRTVDDNPDSPLYSNLQTPKPHEELNEKPEDKTNRTPDIAVDNIKAEGPSLLKNEIDVDTKTPEIKKRKSTKSPKRKSPRKKLKLDDTNDQNVKENPKKAGVPEIGKIDFEEDEDDNAEGDSLIQKAISELESVMEDIDNDNSADQQDADHVKDVKNTLDQPKKCEVCCFEVTDDLSYQTHLRTHSPDKLTHNIIWAFFEKSDKIYSCKKCSKKFKNKNAAFAHSKYHLGIAPFSCEMCNKSFQDADELKKHYICHGSYKAHVCHHCNKGFGIASRLKRHLLTHSDDRDFMCETCGGKFNTRGYLREHMKIHLGSSVERNKKQRTRYQARPVPQCPVCGKFIREMKDHLKLHKNERNYHCAVCDKSFVTRKMLNKHSKIHLGIKKFVCPFAACGQAFLEKAFLDRHLVIHSKCDTFNSLKCDYCVATFSSKSSLDKHLKLHKSKKKWTCEICNRVFAKQNKLEAHHVVHTREKPHKCDVCKTSFTQKGTLQRHMKERHSSVIKF